MNKRSAIAAIEKHGILLVYPIKNKEEPKSLWSHFYTDEMIWEWDEDGDDRVADLWHLRMQLSCSGKVVYAKFYQGRATFFSKEIFISLLCLIKSAHYKSKKLSGDTKKIMRLLDANSPLSTKRLKKETDLVGKFNERNYTMALKELWNKLLIVGYGEVDDGAFPSLAVGSTELLFEDLWKQALVADEKWARAFLVKKLAGQHALLAWIKKHCGI